MRPPPPQRDKQTIYITLEICDAGILLTDGWRHIIAQDSKEAFHLYRNKLACGYEYEVTITDRIAKVATGAHRVYRERWTYENTWLVNDRLS